jgi:DnaJ like chaperone protein
MQMSLWGTLVGGAFGFMMGGPIGAILGSIAGNHFDKGIKGTLGPALQQGEQQRAQAAFFTATFATMGHIAKADGKVTQDEIAVASRIMDQLDLVPEMRKAAIDIFNEGKSSSFDLDDVLNQFRLECNRSGSLINLFLEIQVQAAYADGVMHSGERAILHRICETLRISLAELQRIENLVNGSSAFHGQESQSTIEDAYHVLGVAKSNTDKEVKKAYRRLMSQHHPDKMVSKGLPEEMINIAKEKTQDIRKAYDQVKETRGMR